MLLQNYRLKQKFNYTYFKLFLLKVFIVVNMFFTVFEIVLKVCEGMSWQDTLIKVLPVRKGVHVCDNVSNSSIDISNNSDKT